MGLEEQREEREVLESIFPDEITDISDTAYRISIVLDVTQRGEEDAEPPTLILQVTYPDAYPDKPPLLDLSNPPNAPKYSHLDIQEDKSRLLEALQPVIEENMGMAMVFTLVSTVKDSAELLISERQQAVQALKDVEAARAEEEENRKFHGTAVTRESFLAWRERFRREMEEEEQRGREEKELEDRKKRGAKEETRMTGRELWEKGLVGRVEEDDEGEDGLGESQSVEEVTRLEIKYDVVATNGNPSNYKEGVTILVGPNQESYVVHRDLICAKSPFSKAACTGNLVEGAEEVVRLRENKLETFVLLLEWLYTDRIAKPDYTEVGDWHEIAPLYGLTEKLQMSDLKNAVVDT